jgi:hypothetical protein
LPEVSSAIGGARPMMVPGIPERDGPPEAPRQGIRFEVTGGLLFMELVGSMWENKIAGDGRLCLIEEPAARLSAALHDVELTDEYRRVFAQLLAHFGPPEGS